MTWDDVWHAIALCMVGVVLGHPHMDTLIADPCDEDLAYDDATYSWPTWE